MIWLWRIWSRPFALQLIPNIIEKAFVCHQSTLPEGMPNQAKAPFGFRNWECTRVPLK